MIRPRHLLAALTLLLAAPAAATPPERVVDAVRARAEAAGFQGTILIGEPDGSSQILTIGPDPAAPDARWRWASITKQLLAVIAMQEVAAGRLNLDAPVMRYWSQWRAPHADRIRIRDLMFHRSGLPQPDDSPRDADGIPAFYRSAAVRPDVSAMRFCAGPPRAAPPAAFHYNNCDSIVLAEILRRTTGKSFATLIHERFARPLALRSLGLFVPERWRRGDVRPTGEEQRIDALLDLGVYGASGSAYGTIGDLWRFDHALLTGRLLPAASREQMWTSTAANGYLAFFQWIYPAPLTGCGHPVRIVERQGLIGGIELRNWLLPDSGRALILFSRHRPTGIGDPWTGSGFGFDLLSAVACR